MKFMAAFSRETGIAFNVTVKDAPGNQYALLGVFAPQNLRLVVGKVPPRTGRVAALPRIRPVGGGGGGLPRSTRE